MDESPPRAFVVQGCVWIVADKTPCSHCDSARRAQRTQTRHVGSVRPPRSALTGMVPSDQGSNPWVSTKLPSRFKSPPGPDSHAGSTESKPAPRRPPAVVRRCLDGLKRPRCRGAHGDPGRSVAEQLNRNSLGSRDCQAMETFVALCRESWFESSQGNRGCHVARPDRSNPNRVGADRTVGDLMPSLALVRWVIVRLIHMWRS